MLTCVRQDALLPGNSYPPITVSVDVALDAPSNIINLVQVSGGGTGSDTAQDETTVEDPPPPTPIPTLDIYGMILLIFFLIGGAVHFLRKNHRV